MIDEGRGEGGMENKMGDAVPLLSYLSVRNDRRSLLLILLLSETDFGTV